MKKKILIICGQEIINERNDGGKKCSYRNYELFQNVFGNENTYLCMFTNSQYENGQNVFRLSAYKNIFERIMNVLKGNLFTCEDNEYKVVDFIEKNKIDIVVFERSMYGSLIKKITKRNLECKKWVFVHNLEQNYFRKKLKNGKLINLIPYLQIKKSEKETFLLADYIITLTQRDSELINRYYNRKSDLILPMAFRDTYCKERLNTTTNESKELLFIGTMFPPNYDGIKWFVENVMTELEDIKLTIVGKNFESKKKELERENVQVVGTVENLEDYYYTNNVMIMPIFYGDGMKIKTAEAMMYGKIILASDEALEGYDVQGINGIYRCNTVEEYVNVVKNIFMTEEYKFSKEVRKLFLNKYCLDNQIKICTAEWI